jgi:hypothetical protein
MFAVVAANPPKTPVAQMTGPWSGFLGAIDELGSHIGTRTRPSESTWFLDLTNETQVFAAVVEAARVHSIPLHILYFKESPVVPSGAGL